MLGAVNYFNGQFFELGPITEAARKKKIKVGYDLAHAIGNVPLKLNEWGVDFAVWCSYKYLNSGPGGIAGAFIHEKHAKDFSIPRFSGWWGHDKNERFKMDREFKPNKGAEGWQLSNPPIFQLAALRASLDVFDDAGFENLRAKSIKMTALLEDELKTVDGIEILTPTDPELRGAQLSFRVPRAKELSQSLKENRVVVDFREPDVIRVAPTPLYNHFWEIQKFVEVLKKHAK